VPTKSSVWSVAAGFLLGSSSISWGARGVPRNRRVASSVHLRDLAIVLALDLRHHVGDELLSFFFDACSDLEALERHHLGPGALQQLLDGDRSEEHTSELQS